LIAAHGNAINKTDDQCVYCCALHAGLVATAMTGFIKDNREMMIQAEVRMSS
jgi:hypothetical protein